MPVAATGAVAVHRAALLDRIVDPDLVGDGAERLAGGHDRDRRRRKHGRTEHAGADEERRQATDQQRQRDGAT